VVLGLSLLRVGRSIGAQRAGRVAKGGRLAGEQLIVHRSAPLLVLVTQALRELLSVERPCHGGVVVVKVQEVPHLERLVRVGDLKAVVSGPVQRPR